MLEFECPHCHEILNIPEQFLGHTGKCRKCGNTITITQSSTHDTAQDDRFDIHHPPVFLAIHIETSGPSSRKNNIIEIGAVKFTLHGEVTDTFRSLANPNEVLPPVVKNTTGINDELLEDAPPSHEVVKRWFAWAGPHILLFSHDAHVTAKFLTASLLKEDLTPPPARIIDVIKWAEMLKVPLDEYKLPSLLDFLGFRVMRTHRALNYCHGITNAVGFLNRLQVGMIKDLSRVGILGRYLEGTLQPHHEIEVLRFYANTSKTLEQECGKDFAKKVRQFAQHTAHPASKNSRHSKEWFVQRRTHIEKSKQGSSLSDDELKDLYDNANHGSWQFVLLEASRSTNRDTRKRLCEQAIRLGALDPWPYVRLTSFYIEDKNYEAAKKLCEQYFETDTWKDPRWAGSSLKLLDRLEKLELKLAKQ